MSTPDLSSADERALVEELARAVLEQAAPEELLIFEETSREYFSDPRAVLHPPRRDEAVGFGLDAALLTPYALAVATPVLSFLLQTVADAARSEAQPVIRDWVRRLLRRSGRDAGDGVAPLTPQQAARVQELARSRAADLGLPEEQQRLLADSVLGGLVVAS
jgi:hypothetical protein